MGIANREKGGGPQLERRLANCFTTRLVEGAWRVPAPSICARAPYGDRGVNETAAAAPPRTILLWLPNSVRFVRAGR
jgi:hypothetical protein